MKTKLLLFACIISLGSTAQVNQINIKKVFPTTLCSGDSLQIWFVFINQGGQQNCVFQINPPLTILWQGNWGLFASMPTEVIDGVTYSKLKVKIPVNTTVGTHSMTSSGTHTANGFMVNNCATGLQEQNYDLDQAPVYFDLQGNQINKKTNELIIEQVGLRRKKIFISL